MSTREQSQSSEAILLAAVWKRLVGLDAGVLPGDWSCHYLRGRLVLSHPERGTYEITVRQCEDLPPECLVI